MAGLLLDTNIVIGIVNDSRDRFPARLRDAIDDSQNRLMFSIASLWEIVIKFRLGKLELNIPPNRVSAYLAASQISMLSLETAHVLGRAIPEPATRDPFDRMLLSISQVEDLKLVTTDKALRDHPLVY